MQDHRSPPLLLLALFGTALAARPAAQSPLASSDSYVLAARTAAAASGAAASPSYAARTTVGLAAEGQHASSASYALDGGIALVAAQLSPGAPVVLGVTPGKGDADGGLQARVFGFNLVDPSGVPQVLFGGQPAPTVAETTNTRLDVVTPPGENAHGNPLALVDVRISSSTGSDTLDDAYVYLPALTQATPAHVGQTFALAYDAGQPAFHMLCFGGSVPGLAIPLPPLEGALEVLSPLIVLTGLKFAPQGTASYALTVPNDPSLVGFVVELQDSAITSLAPLAGGFTNQLDVQVLP